ncbi:MAG: hypothetical protein U1F71_17430 [Verrucomicrobiaceae bacterium]
MSRTVLRLLTADSLHELACPLDVLITVGSGLECEIVLDGATILPRHCEFRRVGDQRFRIKRAVPEAWFTVNGVCAPDLEVDVPFRFGIGTEVITFDLAVEGEAKLEQSGPDTAAADVMNVAGAAQPPAHSGRRDYLLQPATLRRRAGDRSGVVVESTPAATLPVQVVSESATAVSGGGLRSVTRKEAPAPASKPELNDMKCLDEDKAQEESSGLVWAGLCVCGLMIGAIIYWQHHLDAAPPAEDPVMEAVEVPTTREFSTDEMVAIASELRRAHMPMLSAHLLMPLAESGRVDAMHELALALMGAGEFSDEAVYLLRQSAEGGSRAALADLVESVENPSHMERYSAESFKHLEFAARLGERTAWIPLGERLEQGHGVAKDLDLALAAYQQAGQAGERRAAIKLAATHDAMECVAAFVRSWNEVSVATVLDHVALSPEQYFGQKKPAMEALLRAEEQFRVLWPLRRINVAEGARAHLRSFDLIQVEQPFQFEVQRGERIARGSGVVTCEVQNEEGGWRVVAAQDEIALKELLPSGDQFVTAGTLRGLKPAFSHEEEVEEARLEILEMMRGIEETQDFKPALTLLLNKAMTFPQEDFWRPFADKLCDRMAREFFAQGRWLDAAWSAPVHQLAEIGSVSAMLLEGHLLMAGYGYARDEKRGIALYQKAFEAGGRRDARFYYAEALFQGRGVPQDLDKASILVLSYMARSKHPLEAYLAAHLLWRKAEIDPSLWQDVYDTLSRVADKLPPAKHLAAMVLLNHGNTTRERKTGFAALKAAAEAGVTEAMKNLSKCYLDGVGCEKDLHQATLWKQKALVTEPPRRRHYTEFEG